ncbi:hypothetical protein Tco_1389671, partial [Tanacetum coccineum]
FVMSDSEDSTVTYTEAPPSLDYVPGPEYPPLLVHVPYVPEPVYPEFMPLEDDVLPAEDQPLPADVSPTADSPGYITESDPKEDPKEEEFLAISTPPPSPLTSYSSPLPHIPSPPLPVSSPLPVSPPSLLASPTYPLGYRAAMIRLRAESPSTSHPLPLSTPPSETPPLLPIPLPTSSPPLLLPSTSRRADVPEVTLPPQKRADYGFVGTLDDEIRRDPKREVGYGITDTWDDMDTYEIYVRLDDAQDDRSLMSGQLNMMRRDRRTHARTARLMETEARLSHEAWVQSMDASDTACSEVRALRTIVLAQHAEIRALQAADHT